MRCTRTILISVALLLSSTQAAFAYIDPVTTSIVLQALVGGFAGVMVAFRRVREKVFGVFRKKPIEADKHNGDVKAGD